MPIAYYVLFTIFFYFTSKQIYAGNHFTGASKSMKSFLCIIGIINDLLIVAFLIFLLCKGEVLGAILSLIIAYVVYFILLRITNKCVMSRHKDAMHQNVPMESVWSSYNWDLDKIATAQAIIGLPITTGCIIYFIYLLFK